METRSCINCQWQSWRGCLKTDPNCISEIKIISSEEEFPFVVFGVLGILLLFAVIRFYRTSHASKRY
jgi:hypothetical protein